MLTPRVFSPAQSTRFIPDESTPNPPRRFLADFYLFELRPSRDPARVGQVGGHAVLAPSFSHYHATSPAWTKGRPGGIRHLPYGRGTRRPKNGLSRPHCDLATST